ncbi:SpvB/TcaC N-terminal domain-containing protein [Allocoleopsis franciscana]|uniref:RHS repeat-associated core domain protein n=1 Tax=Allocoleopsis franciscana PCC 7113 TaxID=1173027 RepID=K9WPI3_9CYAN|nr:SpvB/TcaC N-terminal domain-containing protein [Allocoleopsis franciscana]AFZ22068.1 RHS repeat-associated core domain protein [Allocoleopsis franciscana PCC 7113]
MNNQERISNPSASSTQQGNGTGAEPDKSYFSPPPAVSLPKGGGAIKGMGEKFAANPVTGTGSMSVPIAISPGRSGFGPQLSLSYDSGAGNGIFGMGWSLSLPSITRKTDKGLPRYWDTEESDVFILSGAEDLVPVLKGDGTVDETVRNGYQIRKYRPRIEGLFARIERWTKVDSGETHWRSISKDNLTTLYGKTAESRIADPNHATHIFSWLICESYDDKGNAIVYQYKSEDAEHSVGINLSQAHEQNRTPQSRATNRYLKRIQYGNQTPRQANEDLRLRKDWMFEVVFDYGEHDRTNPISKEPEQWTTETLRRDPFSSYRAGFEVRTYRLCQRVLMFHHIPDVPNHSQGYNGLVKSTDFTYSYKENPEVGNPIYSFLRAVTQTGYKPDPAGGYIQKSLPPLEFQYSEPDIDETVREVDRTSLENLPQGLDGTRYQWVDLDGEGLSGILTEQGNGWFYKRNLSPINSVRDNSKEHIEAQFAPVELVASKPVSGLANGAQFLDLAGDGQPDLVTLRSTTPGFYERTQDADWENFIPFKSLPILDWDNPNLKFIDLNGDGHSDILITEDECFVWHPSLAEEGFAAAERVRQPWDEEKGVRVVFADSTQSIHLADMSGDGLTDIVRIRNGEVCYWPNLGYGRFGAKVTMDNAPWFDVLELFNQRRIVLADIDGSGTTDILYLSGNGVQVYFNQSGNSWAEKQVLKSFPAIDNVVSVTTLDLLGNGTACLVWSSPLPGSTPRMMRYIDLMGGQKPHLLVKTVNNMGAATIVQYAPSTKFYLQDRLAGKPWITKLPFPVHVVERVETRDYISGNRFVTRYAYHHGYFDGEEREFRGFGFVEQWDTEDYGVFQQGGGTNALEQALHVPPVLTKTWFHTGVYIDRDRISNFFAEKEYYREPQYRILANATEAEKQAREAAFQTTLLPDTILPPGITIQEEREAVRSLKGRILRQEIYALDGSDKEEHPYSVSERNYEIRLIQGRQTNRHAVFYAHDRETIDYHYERSFILDPTDPEPDPKKKRKIFDPRVTHAMTLEVDEFGNGLKSVAIAYPRRNPAYPEQGNTLITYTENQVTNKPNEETWYRIGVPIETRTYELTGYSKTGSRFQISDFVQPDPSDPSTLVHIFESEVNYEDQPTSGRQRRLIERVRSRYRPNSQANTLDPTCLPLGEVESLALPCESLKLAFTPGLLTQIYGSKINASDLNTLLLGEGKYVQQEGNWWISSGRQSFEPTRFYLSTQTKDPFGNVYTSAYDPSHLLVTQTIDPLSNTVQVRNNYRVLQPEEITDPNGNRARVAFDALGMVVGTAVMGKVSENQGDNLTSFVADLDQTAIANHVENPMTNPQNILANATTRLVYDLDRYHHTRQVLPDGSEIGQPVVVYTLARETHTADLATGEPTKIQHSFLYSDGFGREIQTKVQAEPGLAPARNPDGSLKRDAAGKLILEPANPRWVGTGRTVFNNKGKPTKKYEPFFSPDHRYETEPDLVEWGVTPLIHYDPLERVIRTDLPNGTFSKVEFDAWQQTTWDENDTVLESDWYRDRSSPDPTAPEPGNQETRAAWLAAKHANTPTIAHLDTLARTFLRIANNGLATDGTAQEYETRVELDIEGNQRSVTDALGRKVMVYDYDLLGHQIRQRSMDAGDHWMLNNVAGNPIRKWDSLNRMFSTRYDALQRPTHVLVQVGTTDARLLERLVYGEMHSEVDRNLRGQLYQHYDGAGIAMNERYDFKGNLLQSSRRFAQNYKELPDWMALRDLMELGTIATAANAQLESEQFMAFTRYDALNRPIALTTPHHSGIRPNIIQPAYNKANLLEKVDVWLRQATPLTGLLNPSTSDLHAVTNINYNAKGQRTLIEYGNQVRTRYDYDEKTFRLTRLLTIRPQFSEDENQSAQDLRYTYDPVGNITHIYDHADIQNIIYFRNQRVEPSASYEYDPLYRLLKATGREHLGQTGGTLNPPRQTDHDDAFRMNLPHPGDGNAMGNYTERYEYDVVGNILKMIHQAVTGGWTRHYAYNEASLIEIGKVNNRLSRTSLPGDLPGVLSARYEYDAHGNMTQMPHLPLMQWDEHDQLQASSKQVVSNGGTPETTYYIYDASGQRVRKVTERQAPAGATPTQMQERLYLGGFEIYREYESDGSTRRLERETLHIMDDKRRIALVETKTLDTTDNTNLNRSLIRYQHDNHLGSACLELDETGSVISYEEYYPYGSTSYQAGRDAAEVGLKRYRYTDKERDHETWLYYHGARYYAPWLGRWISCDPTFQENLYVYVRNNPVIFQDPNGAEESSTWNRFMGALRVVGGAAQAVVGAAVFVQVEVPVAAQVVGGIAVVHGLDDMQTGLRQLITGRQERSATQQTVSAIAQGAGASRQTAEAIGTGTDIGLGFVSPTGPITGGPRAALQLATTGPRVVEATTGVARVNQVVQGARQVQVGTHVMMAAAGGNGGSGSSSGSSGGEPSRGGSGNTATSPPPENPTPAQVAQSSGAGARRPSLLQQARQAGAAEEIEGPMEVFAHGTTEETARAMVETQGGNLSAGGGNFGGRLFTVPNLDVAGVFANRAASRAAGEQPAIVGIALPRDTAARLRQGPNPLLRLGPIDNPPAGVSPGAQEWVFQPGAIDTLQSQGFFFRLEF